MSKKKLLFKVICVALCVALLSAELFASAAILPFETQYAMKLTSNTEIVVQYGRLDNTQANLAFYTTLAYTE